ncbi:MAG TPA: hypothetical protein VHV83_12435 [Armatimonadota bacterium]|nr:hypothetical protein [Armatimonadota bacterium]
MAGRAKKRPACYEASYQRWFDQALCAWLRQRGLASLADQCDQIREAQADEPFAAFETILRLLDPALEPVHVSFDQAELNQIRTVPYGQQRSFTLHYFTNGPGTPFGAITCTNPTPSVQLDEYVLRQREGTVNITIDTQLDRQAAQGITYIMLSLESGIAKFSQDSVKLRYRIDYPTEVTVRRVFSGIGLGMLLIGLPRVLSSIFGASQPVSLRRHHLSDLWNVILSGHHPSLELVVGFIVLCICLIIGYRIWLRALKRSEI